MVKSNACCWTHLHEYCKWAHKSELNHAVTVILSQVQQRLRQRWRQARTRFLLARAGAQAATCASIGSSHLQLTFAAEVTILEDGSLGRLQARCPVLTAMHAQQGPLPVSLLLRQQRWQVHQQLQADSLLLN